ncbi:hypothetical protein JOF53_003122 [Crossiella equi]|uniref:Alpha-L-arabinofuranosidase B arabinose-binding domain-containing protein n=1 Tax=Crossiella equi TaxID=130796 RepID=A0ABS5AEY7_9PSEU|nr:AbfB domain-containing protein [Crossiella equi]MBP2474250.1 hypothetical protein [Crossiella equi]
MGSGARGVAVTDQDRIRAAKAVGFTEGELSELLLFAERDFVMELWKKATGREVRAIIELALQKNTSTAFAELILVGVFDAKKRDDDNQIREEAQARIDRDLKRRAIATLRITVTPDVLEFGIRDFVIRIWRIAEGAEVKKAAEAVIDASLDVQRQFLGQGIVDAFAVDQERDREQKHQQNEAAKERQRLRDTRANAASVAGMQIPDEMLDLSDDNFIREIRRRAVKDSWVAGEAQIALNNGDPKVWRAFIETGIYEARRKDDERDKAQVDGENRARIVAIRGRAEASGMNPELLKATDAALRGSRDDRVRFLTKGYEHVLRQSLQVTTPGLSGSIFARHENGVGRISHVHGGSADLAKQDATWTVRPGLSDPNCYSFESVNIPDYYLRHELYRVRIAAKEPTDAFRGDATFCPRQGLSGTGVSLEAANLKGRFIRHMSGEIWLANDSGQFDFDRPHMFREDASWQVVEPWVPHPR